MRKKVLIISNKHDISTANVMDWIRFKKHDVYRINGDQFFKENQVFTQVITNVDCSTEIRNETTNFLSKECDSVWFRKDDWLSPGKDYDLIEDAELKKKTLKYLIKEKKQAKYAFFSCLMEGKKVLGGELMHEPTKMQMLIKAKNIGIDIPATLLTTEKKELINFQKKYGRLITKPVSEIEMFCKAEKNSNCAINYTTLIEEGDFPKIPDNFFPSLFQESLDKEVEIRVFYLDRICYSMAIFSQLDDQTKIDFRLYNDRKGNRNVPYKLPDALTLKIQKLMSILNLKTGSLDFIKTTCGRIVFLEVNPYGQYGMTSDPCNYYLDKKIASYLIKV